MTAWHPPSSHTAHVDFDSSDGHAPPLSSFVQQFPSNGGSFSGHDPAIAAALQSSPFPHSTHPCSPRWLPAQQWHPPSSHTAHVDFNSSDGHAPPLSSFVQQFPLKRCCSWSSAADRRRPHGLASAAVLCCR